MNLYNTVILGKFLENICIKYFLTKIIQKLSKKLFTINFCVKTYVNYCIAKHLYLNLKILFKLKNF